ncbi:heat stress transcription factor A-8 [Pyrus ussuriensis x Pyrus communis]|uniref:Heat stress transcription factor A-8 n=1 Tax=Pyrus ussuriensis x Pyrus communis TaxID=2448454 RepID=A0A5N5H880_9ROSA|nr:heat stress transcription factor A-8 [Pyrus ussuriensis x Pyrus communis]
MVKSAEKGGGDGSGPSGSVPPFLRKCYEMVDDKDSDSIISWSEAGDSFAILDMAQFSISMLPKYFKHSNFSSFMRQLNIYGFRKIDPDRWVFANEGFIRGQKHLLKNIARRKHPQGADQKKILQQKDNPDIPSENISENGLWKEVENLKTDKVALKQELAKLRQHQEISQNKLLLLRNRLRGMEKNQQQMLSFLVMAMQSPGFLVQLLHPKENSWRIAEPGDIIEQCMDDDRPVASDGAIVRYQPPMIEAPKPLVPPNSGSGKQPEVDAYMGGMEDFVVNPDFMKMLMDEKSSPVETHAPYTLPDISDDGAWEQFLLASPFLENIEGTKEDGEEPADARMEVEPIVSDLDESQKFDYFVEQMKKSQNFASESTVDGSNMESSQNLEFITEQMGHLASDPNNMEQNQESRRTTSV